LPNAGSSRPVFVRIPGECAITARSTTDRGARQVRQVRQVRHVTDRSLDVAGMGHVKVGPRRVATLSPGCAPAGLRR
jgi:hypothetical protein